MDKIWHVYAPYYLEDPGWFFSTEEKAKTFYDKLIAHDTPGSVYEIESIILDKKPYWENED